MMLTKSSDNKRIAKNTLFLYFRMVFVLLVSLYTTRAILKALGVVDYGIYNVVAGFVSMFAFLNSSMINTIQRFFSFERGKNANGNLNNIYITSVQIQTTLGIITVVVLEVFGLWYINTKMVIPPERITSAIWIFQFSVISLLLLILQIPYSAAIVAHEEMAYYAVVSIVDAIIKLIIALILPFLPYDRLIYYGVLMLMISITNILLYYTYAKKHFKEINYHHSFHIEQFKSMLTFSGWNVFNSFAYTMQGQGLNMLMNAFWGPIVNAAHGIAYQVQAALSGFSENISVAFKPQLVESYAKREYERTKELMYSMSKLGYLMVFVFALPVSLEIKYILSIWLDDIVPDNTAIFTVLILINMALGSLNMPISQTVQAVGDIRSYQTIRSFIVVSVIPISWLALSYGMPAYIVFIILILINIINQPVSMYLLKKIFLYSYWEYFKKVILPCVIFSLLVPIIPIFIYKLMNESLERFLIICTLSVTISIIGAYLIMLTKNEQTLVKEYVFRILKK